MSILLSYPAARVYTRGVTASLSSFILSTPGTILLIVVVFILFAPVRKWLWRGDD